MRRLKKIQLSLLCTAALAAVLCLCAPADKLPALSAAVYVLFVLLPLLAATGLQLLAVRKDLAVLSHYIYIYIEGYSKLRRAKKKHIPFSVIRNDEIHTIASLRSEGIDPCRAGPFRISV